MNKAMLLALTLSALALSACASVGMSGIGFVHNDPSLSQPSVSTTTAMQTNRPAAS